MKAKWDDGKYSVYYLTIARGLHACVEYDGKANEGSGGYKVTFLEQTLLARPKDVNEAKTLAVRFAKQKLTEALASLAE